MGQGILPHLIAGDAAKVGAKVTEPPSDDPVRRTYELRKTPNDAPFLRIVIKATGSNTALPDLVGKYADAGVSSRPYTDQEIDKLIEIRGMGKRADVEHVIALDGVQFFVNRENPAAVMKLCDVAKVLGGKLKNWSEFVLLLRPARHPHRRQPVGHLRNRNRKPARSLRRNLEPRPDPPQHSA